MRLQNNILSNLHESKADDFYYLCNSAEAALFEVRKNCPNKESQDAIDRMILDLNNIRMENYEALKEYSLNESSLKESPKWYTKKGDEDLLYSKSKKGTEFYKNKYTLPLKDRKSNRVFVPGDRVVIARGTDFDGSNMLVGKTGTIVDEKFIGTYPQVVIEFDKPLKDRYNTDSWIVGEDSLDFYTGRADKDFDEAKWRDLDEKRTKEFLNWVNMEESQSQEIENITKDVEKKNPGFTEYLNAYYNEINKNEPKIAWDYKSDRMNPEWEKWYRDNANVLYNKKAWNKFKDWVKKNYKISLKEARVSSSTDWIINDCSKLDGNEIAKDGYLNLIKLNSKIDDRGSNYIMSIDNYEINRFNANSDEEAIKEYNNWKDIMKNKINWELEESFLEKLTKGGK